MTVSLQNLKPFIPCLREVVLGLQALDTGFNQPTAIVPVTKETVELDRTLAKTLNQPEIDYDTLENLYIPAELVIEFIIHIIENGTMPVESIEERIQKILTEITVLQGEILNESKLAERPIATICSKQGESDCEGFSCTCNCCNQ